MSVKMSVSSGSLRVKRSKYSDSDDDNGELSGQPVYSHVVQLIVPIGSLDTLHSVKEISRDQPYYCVKNLVVGSVLKPQFIQAFVKRGKLHMLSHDTNIDTASCLALLPYGKLILHVTKDDYEILGLEGRPSKFGNNKYVIEIDLLSPHFIPGTKGYDRVCQCFLQNSHLTWTCLVAWDPHDEAISPLSLKAYFEDSGHTVISCELDVEEDTLKNLKTPQISYNESSEEIHQVFWEWLGTAACGVRWGRDIDDWVCNIGSDQTLTTISQCKFISVTGFITSQTVQKLYKMSRKAVAAENTEWSCLVNHGFQDSPVSLKNHEHGFDMNGDNISVIVNLKDNYYWHYTYLGKLNVVS